MELLKFAPPKSLSWQQHHAIVKRQQLKSQYRVTYRIPRILTTPKLQLGVLPRINDVLSPSQLRSYQSDGYLIISSLFLESEISSLKTWSQEIHDLPRTPDCIYIPYDEINAAGEQVLCRTENFCSSHAKFNNLLRGKVFLDILRQLAEEDMLLFKEKINYKFAGSGGFKPHIDRSGYGSFKNLDHISILVAIDDSTRENGCLEVVPASHKMEIPISQAPESKNTICSEWVDKQNWLPVSLKAGEILIFGTSLAHRSAANLSSKSRRAVYATYSPASSGDLHDAYYERRAKAWPATHKREPGKNYELGKQSYAYGTPMLSINA